MDISLLKKIMKKSLQLLFVLTLAMLGVSASFAGRVRALENKEKAEIAVTGNRHERKQKEEAKKHRVFIASEMSPSRVLTISSENAQSKYHLDGEVIKAREVVVAIPGKQAVSFSVKTDAEGYACLVLQDSKEVLGIIGEPQEGMRVVALPLPEAIKQDLSESKDFPGKADPWQKWKREKTDNGSVLFRCAANENYVLAVEEESVSSEAKLIIQEYNGENSQLFRLLKKLPESTRPSEAGIHYLRTALSDWMLLSIGDGIYNDERNIYIYLSDQGDGQFFSVEYDKDGYAVIHHNRSSKVLTVRNHQAKDGQEVGQCEYDGEDWQKWILDPAETGGYYIRSVLNPEKVLDVITGEVYNYSPVQLNQFTGQDSQVWFFTQEPIYPPTGQEAMDEMAQSRYSDTSYLIMVDTTKNHVGVYLDKNGANSWENLFFWPCVTGKWSTPTPTGEYTIYSRQYSFDGNMDSPAWYTCYYATEWCPAYFFHSIIYYQGTWDIMDATMGANASHGCIRLETENAKWIYENVPAGSKVVIY